MIEDNTPTVTSRRRKPPPKLRLRLETAKRLQILSTKAKLRREKKKLDKREGEGDITVTADSDSAVPKIPLHFDVKARKAKVKKATLKSPDTPKSKFRKRQIHKAWLPTHLFHAKRAHMTAPKEPLWRFAIPLSPTNKTYRVTHRAISARGAMVWDTSYMATIGLEGLEKSIEGLLKALGVGLNDVESMWKASGSKWRQGSRAWDGWLYQRESWPSKCVAPATIIWNPIRTSEDNWDVDLNALPEKLNPRRQAFIRVHPSGFFLLWEEIIRLAKVQKPSVTVEDLRFEVGSFEITGPNAAEALVGTLRPIGQGNQENSPNDIISTVWHNLAAVANPSTLPAHAIISFEIFDPRLHSPPRTLYHVNNPETFQHHLELMAAWPLDELPRPIVLFDRNARMKASRSLPSQKSINRRKAAAIPGEYPEPRSTDPRIPTLLFTTRSRGSQQGTWTIMLPWKCMLPVWTRLVHYPLSCGGNILFGGLEEKRQLAFESGIPWFPGDFPGTKAGDEWEVRESSKRKEEWDRKPKSRRVEWDNVNLGNGRIGEVGKGWSCDWGKLAETFSYSPATQTVPPITRVIHTTKDVKMQVADQIQSTTTFYHLPYLFAHEILTTSTIIDNPQSALITVRLTMLNQGVPQICARIYRLPTNDIKLRESWFSLLPSQSWRKSPLHKRPSTLRKPPKVASNAEYRAYLATRILDPDDRTPNHSTTKHLPVPDEVDLIGFVTTGNFNLTEGLGTGIGSIALAKVLGGDLRVDQREQKLCIVRDAGQNIGRLARWEIT
jgi:ribonuclease P/MRP protein subunit POP1